MGKANGAKSNDSHLRKLAKARIEEDGLGRTAEVCGVHPQTLKSFAAGCDVHRGTVLAIEKGLKA